MRVYVSGRIKDYEGYLEHFAEGCRKVADAGHRPVNPCELGEPDMTYEEFMRTDLRALLHCDAIYMLDGWEKSVGARCEHMVASMSGFEVFYESSRELL